VVLKLLLLVNSMILFIFVLAALMCWINFIIHKSMTRENSKKQAVGTYWDFLYQFNQQEWENDNVWESSFFNRETDSKYHASIIKFNGVGMIMKNTLHYFLVGWYIFRLTQAKKREKVFGGYYWRAPKPLD